jgi:hypothetical protein
VIDIPQQQPTSQEQGAASTSSGAILVTTPKWQYAVPLELIEDPMLTSANLKQFQDTFKDLCKFSMVSVLDWVGLPLSIFLDLV